MQIDPERSSSHKQIKMSDLRMWVEINPTREFPDRPPGMSVKMYFLLRMFFYLPVEAEKKSVSVYVGGVFE